MLFLVPIFYSESVRAELSLSTKGKKQIRRRVSYWVKAKDPPVSVTHLTMSNNSCLRKGKTGQAGGDPLAPECFLRLCLLLCIFKNLSRAISFMNLFNCFLKTWTYTAKKDMVSQFDYVSHEGSPIFGSVCFVSHS